MQYSIYYPTPLDKIKDIYNDNIDVCVQIKKANYTFVIVTIENLKESAWLNKVGYVTPSAPILIVEKLTKEIIEALIEELFKDKALVKIYGKDLK